jgi:hypothetical protein
MKVSIAHAIAAGGTVCGGQVGAARIVGGKKARKPIRRNGHFIPEVGDRDSVGGGRKFVSHCYFGGPRAWRLWAKDES